MISWSCFRSIDIDLHCWTHVLVVMQLVVKSRHLVVESICATPPIGGLSRCHLWCGVCIGVREHNQTIASMYPTGFALPTHDRHGCMVSRYGLPLQLPHRNQVLHDLTSCFQSQTIRGVLRKIWVCLTLGTVASRGRCIRDGEIIIIINRPMARGKQGLLPLALPPLVPPLTHEKEHHIDHLGKAEITPEHHNCDKEATGEYDTLPRPRRPPWSHRCPVPTTSMLASN